MSRERWDQKDWTSQETEEWLRTKINYAIYIDDPRTAREHMKILIANRQLDAVQSIDLELQMRRLNGT